MPVEQGYRTILVLDIEQFSQPELDDQVRVRLRRGLHEVLTQALADMGVAEQRWKAASTGDGLLVAVDPTVPTARVVRALLDYVPAGLAEHNRLAAEVARIRARAVIHAAHVLLDEQGIVGQEVNLAFRLLDSDPLRARLRQATGSLVVAVSEDVYQQVVRQHHLGLDPDEFASVEVQAKEARRRMWVRESSTTQDASAAQTGEPTPSPSAPSWPWPLFVGFDRHYRRYLLGLDMGRIDFQEFSSIGPHRPELDEVFIDVSVDSQPPNHVYNNPLFVRPTAVSERHRIWDFLAGKRARLAVLGAPGSGKTTLLRHIAREACKSPWRRKTPVLVSLRHHHAAIVEDPSMGLASVVRRTADWPTAEEPPGWLEGRIRKGRCLVLLDGLDEVARREDWEQVVDWVNHQITKFPDNDYLITARPYAYHSPWPHMSTILGICPFTPQQVEEFVHKWYLAEERHTAPNASQTVVLSRARQRADDLLQRLNRAPALQVLTVNPLLLTMIAIVHRVHNTLPDSRAALYAEICQVLLARRPGSLSGAQKEVVLRALAFTLMQEGKLEMRRDQVLEVIAAALPPDTTSAEDFLSKDATASGLLIEQQPGVYAFAHLTFQEYLAAAHIREHGMESILAEKVTNSWWRETTLLYVAGTGANPADVSRVVSACLDDGSVTALALAFDCADQASTLDADLCERLDRLRTETGAPDASRELRHLVARVKVADHLRQSVWVTARGQICRQPISSGLYDLFLQDEREGGTQRIPDAPERTTPGTTDEVAVGMRGDDAHAFVQWLNQLVNSSPGFRLPTPVEVALLDERGLFGTPTQDVWCTPPGSPEHQSLWSPTDRPNPYLVEAGTLHRCLEADLQKPTLLTILLLTRARIAIGDLIAAIDQLSVLTRRWGIDLDQPLTPHHLNGFCAAARALAKEIQPDRRLDRAADRVLDPDLDLGLDLDRPLERFRTFHGGVDFTPLFKADGHLGPRGVDPLRHLVSDLVRARDSIHDLESAMGSASSRVQLNALSTTPQHNEPATPFHAPSRDEFSRDLVNDLETPLSSHAVRPAELDGKMETALGTLRRLRGQPGRHATAARVLEGTEQLASAVRPVFARERRLDPDTAGAIRVVALCLAAEAFHRRLRDDGVDLHQVFQEIAAGVTQLEQRHSGQTPPTGTIMVAFD